VSISDRLFAKDIGAFVHAVLLDEAVACEIQLLCALIYRRGCYSSQQHTAVKVPVMEKETLFFNVVISEEVASLLDLADLLAQAHGILNVRDLVGLYYLIHGRAATSHSEVFTVIRNFSVSSWQDI